MLPIFQKIGDFFHTVTRGEGYSLRSQCSLNLDLRKKSEPGANAGHFSCGWDRDDDLKTLILCLAVIINLLNLYHIYRTAFGRRR